MTIMQFIHLRAGTLAGAQAKAYIRPGEYKFYMDYYRSLISRITRDIQLTSAKKVRAKTNTR